MVRFALAALLAVPGLMALATPAKANGPWPYNYGVCGSGHCSRLFSKIHQHGPLFNYGPYYGYYPFEPYGPWDAYLRYNGGGMYPGAYAAPGAYPVPAGVAPLGTPPAAPYTAAPTAPAVVPTGGRR